MPGNLKNAVTKRLPGKTTQARNLRQNDQEAEYRLWSDLRNRRLNGYKFSRQIPLGPYIVDFLCREQGLVVEIDGSQHAQSRSDALRTHWLNAKGYAVIRFWNEEILKERRAVLETILAVLTGKIHARDTVLRFYPARQPPMTEAWQPEATSSRAGGHQDNPCAQHRRTDREFGK